MRTSPIRSSKKYTKNSSRIHRRLLAWLRVGQHGGADEARHYGRRWPMARETRESSLDELAKGLASGTVSRGKALRWMGAALIGGALAAVPGMAWAAPAPGKGNCPTGRVKCRGRCVNLQSDANNCGQCSNVCSAAEVCAGGACVCPQGQLGCATGLCACPQGTGCSPVTGECAPICPDRPPEGACGRGECACPPGEFCFVDPRLGAFCRPNPPV
jgi:hypothetical protein